MIAYHDAATDYYRLALKSNLTSLRREHLNQAGKLSRTFSSGGYPGGRGISGDNYAASRLVRGGAFDIN